MNEDQLYQWKLNVRITFLELLCQNFLRTAALAQAEPEKWLQDWAKKTINEFEKLHFPTKEAVQSDMLAAEARDCAQKFVSSLLSKD